ncbi:hypothetical protein CL6EHI_052180 [Entamoeba histolytica]|uniref:Pre-mRNA polyadenylation factor Fip1 domain-containing protein n=6 Tax=Entamoeba histolytica TaxID=5759 RepID=C4M765_ENTH1|nr:hypothetical protein EHI_052180 [Entamoeba histolytica HM-1:IMSS]XP_655354.1 hypothetical protein EHI_083400 [Entamoeba histolytica HM-1:IMSS]EMD44896.1 Hypothetical protein EHI5A_141150 [Entamoeba histolytica KU27]GAT97356.1 hypothetical protein CL6EHI_083400 [Entamoeba histolytica]EAL44010.1 hypothetical protein EHI_052180 [Entamoeba histolytica HM-1:IMSS]EAL49963.1 hypothetical protein EHI_083400 [Entamoeba histolytica HM-1:IMSS]GAT97749.1 hypothetical protein CL6EHI_052180 [Entamoeba h|eukprot:XP_649398.1 hypothetical protein EHI_052180 [Entamoeba histolytica HM-1:IMSS]
MQQNTPQKPQTPSDESYRFYQLLLFNFSHFVADEDFNRYWEVFTGEKGFETLAPEDKPWETEGANLEEYFNYGFNEKTWSAYAKKLRELYKNSLAEKEITTVDTTVKTKQAIMDLEPKNKIKNEPKIEESKEEPKKEERRERGNDKHEERKTRQSEKRESRDKESKRESRDRERRDKESRDRESRRERDEHKRREHESRTEHSRRSRSRRRERSPRRKR